MRDLLPDVDRWLEEGREVALATVIRSWGSSPRGPGAKMALTKDARISGSVSGGCVEGAVMEAGQEVLQTGRPRLLHFGVTDEIAWTVGLSCGGEIEVFVKRLESEPYRHLRRALSEERSAATVFVVAGPAELLGREIVVQDGQAVFGELGRRLDDEAMKEACTALAEGRPRRSRLGAESEETIEIFVDVELPPPTLVVVGGVHIAVALASLAKTLGYRTVVVDPRGVFGAEERFPHADRLVQEWPEEGLQQVELNRSTAVAALTHDPKLDDPALRIALRSPAFYVGALGSRKTQERRRRRLLERGLTEDQLARLWAPIGLDIGSRSPEEIALAVMAQVVAVRNGALRPRNR
ncbi:MAG: XdhC family protein [Acidobacteriota bacterium]